MQRSCCLLKLNSISRFLSTVRIVGNICNFSIEFFSGFPNLRNNSAPLFLLFTGCRALLARYSLYKYIRLSWTHVLIFFKRKYAIISKCNKENNNKNEDEAEYWIWSQLIKSVHIYVDCTKQTFHRHTNMQHKFVYALLKLESITKTSKRLALPSFYFDFFSLHHILCMCVYAIINKIKSKKSWLTRIRNQNIKYPRNFFGWKCNICFETGWHNHNSTNFFWSKYI